MGKNIYLATIRTRVQVPSTHVRGYVPVTSGLGTGDRTTQRPGLPGSVAKKARFRFWVIRERVSVCVYMCTSVHTLMCREHKHTKQD